MRKLVLRQRLMSFLLFAVMLTGISSWGQSNPAAYNLSGGSWTLTGWNATVPSGSYPANGATGANNTTGVVAGAANANMVFWKHGSTDQTIASAATANYTGDYTVSTAKVYGNGTNGFAFDNTGGVGYGSAVLAISTTGRNNVQVVWTGRTITVGARQYGVRLQYRVGNTGSFVDANGTAANILYTGGTAGTSNTFAAVTLPSDANDKALVQVLWRFYYIGPSTGTRPVFGVDDITVSSSPISTNNPILAITGTTGYGSICPTVAATPITYTITNSGAVDAAGVTVASTGTNNADFVISGLSSTTIAANGGTATFTGTFTPSAAGSKTATFTASSTTTNSVSGTIDLTGTGTTPVTQAVSVLAAQTVTASSATIRGTLGTVGVCPATIEKGFVYSKASDTTNPAVGDANVTKTTVANIATGDFTLPISSLTAETIYNYKAYVYNGTTYTYSNLSTFTTIGTPPALTAAVGATVDAPFMITFTDNPTWRNGITSITIGGTTLTAGFDKNVAGQITFTPSASSPASLLQTAGTKTIIINSTNYTATPGLSQAIGVGAPAKLAITTQPTAPSTNGGTLAQQPVVVVRDQYNNATTSTASITAAPSAATWTIGGTTTVSASAGTATFSGLTAGTPTGLTGAAIQFTSGVLTPVTSNTFSIPPSNDLCGNATLLTVNAAAIAGTNVGSTFTTYTGVSGSKKDVWYTFVATCNGSHTITVSDFSGDIDMYLHAATSCPNAAATTQSTNGTPEVLTATLVSGTTYYVRVIAFNTAAESSTFNIQVVNAFVPTVTSVAATSITHQAATIAGTATITGCSGAITAYGVEYSQTSGFANGTGIQAPGSNLTGSNFSVSLAGLPSGTTYYYKTYATNASGTTYSTPQRSFTTTTVPVSLPYTQDFESDTNEWAFDTTGTNKWVVGTGAKNGGAKGLYISNDGTAYSYTIGTAADTNAQIMVDLTSVTAATLSFDWKSAGEVGNLGSIYDYGEVYINTGSTDILISTTKEFVSTTVYQMKDIDLTAYVGGVRTLKFKWVNDTSAGTGIPFAVDNIAIKAGLKPTLSTAAITNLASNSATSGGAISNAGSTAVTARGIVYSTTANPVLLTGTVVNSGTGTGTFSSDMSGLSDNTTYYVRAFATNTTGTAYGAQVTFITSNVSAPVATAATYSDTANSGFLAHWNAVTGATGYKLDVSTSATFGTFSPTTDLFFSEYVEGSGNERYLEIYNGTGATVDLSNYQIRVFANGSSTAVTPTTALSGILANGATIVYGGTSSSIYSGTSTTLSQITFNGNDAVGLWKISTGAYVDVFGRIGSDPGTAWTSTSNSTANKTLVRKPAVTAGITTSPTGTGASAFTTLESQWTQYNQDDVSNLGSHTYVGFNPVFVAGYNDLSVAGTSYDVTGLTAGTTYYYRVRAQGVNSASGSSNTISAVAKQVNTWTAGAWTLGTPPTAMDKAIIESNYNTGANGELTAGQLEVNNGTFTIADGNNVTITNKVIVDNDLVAGVITGDGKIVIENNANLIQVNDVDNSGYATVNKKSAPMFRLDYALWSSPVAGETLIGFSPETNTSRFYHYNPATDAYATVPGTTVFAEGVSYLIRVANNHPAYIAPAVGQPQPAGTQWSGSYEGILNNGNVDVPVSAGIAGYNAVGNPYASPINIHAFYNGNIGSIDQASALYFWRKKNDSETGSYARVTKLAYTANTTNDFGNAAGTAFNGTPSTWVINPGQGFIVQATGSTVHFTNAMRVPVNNNQQFRTAQDEDTMSRLWLNLSGANGGFSQAAIGYTDETTLDIDYGWDGKAFVNDGDVTLFSLAGEETLGIQARPSFDAADVVPMGYNADNAGTYTISLDHMDGVFAQDQDIFLRDNVLGVTHDLKEGGYEFATEAGIITGRFDVIYAAPLGTDNPVANVNNVIVYKQGNSININSGNVDMTGVSVYDMRGRLLYSAKDINAAETVISGLQAEKQVLIVNISTQKGDVSKKIIF